MSKIDDDTLEGIREMKFLYDCGTDLEFLSCIYPLSKEDIVKMCEGIDKNPDLKSYVEEGKIFKIFKFDS